MKVRGGATVALVLALILGPAGASATGSPRAAQAPVPVPPHRPGPHVMPVGPPTVAPPASPLTAAAPAGAHLSYFGGRVLSSVKVVQVIYGSGTYLPETTSSTSPSVSTFFGGVTNSPYFDWLTEYNTNITAQGGQPGSNQAIGRGTFAGRFTIAPSPANNGSPVQDANIRTELQTQILAGHLPAPDANTFYSLFFRNGQSICAGSACSLVTGGFCAYHSTIAAGALPEVYYAVEPDLVGTNLCGAGTAFQNTTSVASHEMIETVTDPQAGLAASNAPPLAWNDPTNGEIGDICNAQQGTVTGGDGVAYAVQQEFSNRLNACIVTRPTYSAAVLADNPLDYWRLNDATTTVHDLVGAKDAGYLTSGVSPTLPPLIAGATPNDGGNMGRRFDTSAAVSLAGSPGSGIVGDCTLEAWFQIPATLGPDGTNRMFSSSSFGPGSWGVVDWYGSIGTATLEYVGGRSLIVIPMADPNRAATQLWHHLALTISGSTTTVYIDARVAGVSGANPSSVPSGPAVIGATGGFDYGGGLQDVAVYNRALTPAQIAAHVAAAA